MKILKKHFIRNHPPLVSPQSVDSKKKKKFRQQQQKTKNKKNAFCSTCIHRSRCPDLEKSFMFVIIGRGCFRGTFVCHPSSNILVSCPLYRFARQKGDSRGENYCSVSNMAGKAHFDPPWLLSSLDKSGVKNGLALIGIFALSFNSLSPYSPNKKLFLELIGQNKWSNTLQFGKI